MKEKITSLIVKLKLLGLSVKLFLEKIFSLLFFWQRNPKFKRYSLWTFVFLIGIGVFLTFSYTRKHNTISNINTKSEQFSMADLISLMNLNGSKSVYFNLKDDTYNDKGNGYVVHFWASWCAPCLEELPHWVEAARKEVNQNYLWVAVAREESWKNAIKVVQAACGEEDCQNNIDFLLDADGLVAERWGSFDYPETFLVNKEFKIIKKLVGPQDWSLFNGRVEFNN